jgi:hypothetical protein
MNLSGFALICRMAELGGVDLWHYQAPNGASVLRALEYLAPYLADPSKWTKEQITPAGGNRGYALGLAGMSIGRRDWVDLQRSFASPGGAWGLLFGMMLDAWQG